MSRRAGGESGYHLGHDVILAEEWTGSPLQRRSATAARRASGGRSLTQPRDGVRNIF
ncbi:hypothetical protein DWUX_1250 [Desulfovibrio diazotrophicus]|nr:hypothetical protein DWUX_1250 [Desulfovibrio diazotrophicus]